jgi:hypothetical protein
MRSILAIIIILILLIFNKKKILCFKDKNDDGNEHQKWDMDKSNMNCCIGNNEMFKEEELLKELDKAQMDSKERQANNQGDKNDSLYRLNIMDTTPENGRENVILTTNKYQNFFDIEEINEL